MVVNINSADFIQKIEEMEERIAKLEEINTVQNKHIAYLQKRTRSFFDRLNLDDLSHRILQKRAKP